MSVHISVGRHAQLQQRVLVADVFEISVVYTQLSVVQKLNDTYTNITERSTASEKYNHKNKLVLPVLLLASTGFVKAVISLFVTTVNLQCVPKK